MTKKHIWAKLLIVALIVAMVGVFFVACKECKNHVDANNDGKCDNCGADVPIKKPPTPDTDTTAVEALFGVIDDAVAALGGIDNVGNLGTDAFVELAIEQDGVKKMIRIDLDLSLDLLKDSEFDYANNGFGFTISTDDGENGLTRVFGIWYVDAGDNEDNFVYLSAGGQNLKIDALTLANVLATYNVNANVPVSDKLADVNITDMVDEELGLDTFAEMLPIVYTENNGNKEFSVSLTELLDPTGTLGIMANSLLFGPKASIKNLIGASADEILAQFDIDIASLNDLIELLPDLSLVVTGNYEGSTFKSIGLGLAVAGQDTGITIPQIKGDGIELVAEGFVDTDLSATIGFTILESLDAYDNVAASLDAVLAEDLEWIDTSVLNFAFEADVKLGNSADNVSTYKMTVSADINAAKVADAVFTKRVYYTDGEGNYVTEADGTYKYADWFYLRGAGMFAAETDADVIQALLPGINSLYVCLENTEDPEDKLLINVEEPITVDEGGNFTGGRITINLAAFNNIVSLFGLNLPEAVTSLIGDLDGSFGVDAFLGIIRPALAGFIYPSDEEQANMTLTKPADFEEKEEAAKEEANKDDDTTGDDTTGDDTTGDDTTGDDTTTEEKPDVKGLINQIIASLTFGTDSVTAANSDEYEYVIGGADLTFDITASLLKDEAGKVNGIKVVTNDSFVANYNNGEVLTEVDASIQIGGEGNLFKAEITVDQTKKVGDPLYVYVALDINKIGYACAVRTPIDADAETINVFRDGAGWVASK